MRVKLSILLLAGSIGALLSSSASAEVSFEKQVKPVLESACLSCHGEKKPKGELAIHTYEALLEGSEYGEVVVPGKPEDSTLYTTTILPPDADEVMPVSYTHLRSHEKDS